MLHQAVEKIAKIGPDIILNLGDTFHAKLQLSPEAVILARWFFGELSKIAPVYTIVGNHDMNVTNPERPSSVEAVLFDIPNHTILKASQFITIAEPSEYKKGLNIWHFSFYQSQNEWPKHIDERFRKGDYVNVALYHGGVDSYVTDTNWRNEASVKSNEWFNEYDLLLCGDIHQYQQLNERSWMVGNLIQQNFGEDVAKGFLSLNIVDKDMIRFKQHFLINDYAYMSVFVPTANFDEAKIAIDKELESNHITKNSNIRIVVSTSNILESSLKTEISQYVINKFAVTPIIEEDFRLNQTNVEQNSSRVPWTPVNFTDCEYQNKLITEYSEHDFHLPKEISLDQIHDVNRELNDELGIIKTDSYSKIWELIRFNFSNLYQYGSVDIDFDDDMVGLVGLFGDNAAGKSNLFNALCFAIYGKPTTNIPISEIIHYGASNAESEIFIRQGNNVYRITRNLSKSGDKVSNKVAFAKLGYENNWIPLNDETVPKTNQAIAETFGSMENFKITTLAVQNQYAGFVRSTNSQRKETVMENLGLGLFQQLYDLSKLKSKEITDQLKVLGDPHAMLTSMLQYQQLIEDAKNDQIKNELVCKEAEQLRDQIDTMIDAHQKKIKPVSCMIINDKEVDKKIQTLKAGSNKIKAQIVALNDQGTELAKKSTKSLSDVQKMINDLSNEMNAVDRQLGIDVAESKRRAKVAEKYGDVNCDRTDCVLLKMYKDEAGNTGDLDSQIQAEQNTIAFLRNKIESLKAEKQIHDQLALIAFKINELNVLVEKAQIEIEHSQKLLDAYNENKDVIASNEKVQAAIDDLRDKRSQLTETLATAKAKISSSDSLIKEYQKQVKRLNTQIDQHTDLTKKANAILVYRDIMEKNALPNNILLNYISILESEVNKILERGSYLKAKIALDYKDGRKTTDLNIFFLNKQGEWHPIEASSGAEEMLLSLAIRVALINITTVNKCNMLIIDEGFGTLQASRIPEIHDFFNVIKSMFKTVIIVSHLESIQDIPDRIVVVVSNNESSSLVF